MALLRHMQASVDSWELIDTKSLAFSKSPARLAGLKPTGLQEPLMERGHGTRQVGSASFKYPKNSNIL
jgi:hypothetical protein